MTRKSHSGQTGEGQTQEKVETTRPKATTWVRPDNPPSSIYANQVELQITNWDFRFRFGEVIDQQSDGASVAERARIIMSPQHTKAFLNVLSENVRKYEAAFGEIRVNPIEKIQKPQ